MIILKTGEKGTNGSIVGMFQIHGNNVAIVGKKDAGTIVKNCDGLITNDPGIYLAVSVADCVPLAVFDPATKSIGLLHAGWKGLAKGIINKAINKMKENFSLNPANLLIEIGPHICSKHYEIKSDVTKFFPDHPKAIEKSRGKMYLNLSEIAKEQLVKAGVKPENIKIDKRCTYEDTSLPSYRRGDFKKRIHYLLKIPSSP